MKANKKDNSTDLDLKDLLEIISDYQQEADVDLITLAYEYAREAHKGQTRASGAPYIFHPLHTAYNLAKLRLDQPTVIAGLLHDIPEDTNITLNDIEKNFGREVAQLVGGVTKLGHIKYRGLERYAENLRKMFLAMAKDIRVIFIKFADRLHNLETIKYLPEDKQKRIALESLEIYAPIANRLGINEIRHQLEDEAFKILSPDEYRWVISLRKEPEKIALKNLEKVKKKIIKETHEQEIETLAIIGRQKRIYSLYKKLLKKDRDINKIYDLIALRLILPSIADCYKTMGIIHSHWRPVPGRIKDYIAVPKPNGYRSLHTTIFTESGQIVEIQLRTPEMHEQAEYGIAAHWHYKEKGSMKFPNEQLKWINEIIKIQKKITNNEEYLKEIKLDIFSDFIYVFTPRGDVIELPENASPVDFAYRVHTYVGNHCSGAKVNEQIVSLDSILKSGDVVEIIVDKNRKGPGEDWLNFVKTRTARDHIKVGLKKNSRSFLNFDFPSWRKKNN